MLNDCTTFTLHDLHASRPARLARLARPQDLHDLHDLHDLQDITTNTKQHMIIELKIPSPGESVNEVEIASWLVDDGDFVEKDQEIAELESDKATLPLMAPESGILKILIPKGDTAPVGAVACSVDTGRTGKKVKKGKAAQAILSGSPDTESIAKSEKESGETEKKIPVHAKKSVTGDKESLPLKITPLAKKMMQENGLSIEDILTGLKKITTKEVNQILSLKSQKQPESVKPPSRESQRMKMSQLRKKLGQRLVAVKNETAMLTTFNEVDMSNVIHLRKNYQKQFQDKYGIKLGFMSFFVKAASGALQLFPRVNSMIDGDDIVTPDYVDVCIAVQTDKGLMVPVIRNTESLSLPQIEIQIARMAEKARSFKISIEEMTGGTFTITNGGVFGSMLSTPIINPPQSAILGMHNIVERAVVISGKIEARPIMYVALSYDHRIVDGRDSVSFLVKVKEFIENPALMITGGADLDKLLLGI
jgi:2-oxoglutarate dehydrogenase E2 component (dihydrolipoamide succinyltransferase)